MLYFALQQDIDLKKLPGWFFKNHIRHWMYAGDDSTWRVQAELSVPRDIQRISLAAELDRKSWELRNEYLTLIGELSIANNSSEWWGSEIASKNPYTQLYTRICLLAASREYIENHPELPVIIVCSTPALKQELIAFAEEKKREYRDIRIPGVTNLLVSCRNNIQSCLGLLLSKAPPIATAGKYSQSYQKLLNRREDYRRSVLKQKNIQDLPKFSGDNGILLFTWIDHRNFTSDGKYRDPHFGPLPDKLKQLGYEVIFVPRILFTFPYREAINKLLKTGERFLFMEQCVTSSDIALCEQRARQFQPHFSKDLRIGAIPVFSLISEHFENYRKTLSDNLQYERTIKYLAEQRMNPRQVIHTCEGHSWEQILKWSVQRYLPATKVVGFDNLTFSRLVLSMFPAENELQIRPIPDRIVTNGPMFYEVLKNEGLPWNRIRSGCALRHTYLWVSAGTDSIETGNDNGPVKVLVATSIGLGDSVELAAKAAQAFGGDDSYDVRIKCHPMVDISQVRSFLGPHVLHRNIRFVTEPIDAFLPQMDLLLYTYTSICFEALRFGVYPICVRSENFLNLDPLDAAPQIRGIATTAEEIRIEAEKFAHMQSEKKREYKIRSLSVLKQALAPVTDSCIDSFII